MTMNALALVADSTVTLRVLDGGGRAALRAGAARDEARDRRWLPGSLVEADRAADLRLYLRPLTDPGRGASGELADAPRR